MQSVRYMDLSMKKHLSLYYILLLVTVCTVPGDSDPLYSHSESVETTQFPLLEGDIWQDPRYTHCIKLKAKNWFGEKCYPGNNETVYLKDDRNSCLLLFGDCFKVYRDKKFLDLFFSSPSSHYLDCFNIEGIDETFYVDDGKGILLKVNNKDLLCEFATISMVGIDKLNSSAEGSYESEDIWKDPRYNHCVPILKQNGKKWNKKCYSGNNETDDLNVESTNSCLQINRKCYEVHRDGKFLEPFFSSPSVYDLPCLTFKGENFYMDSEKGLLLKVTEKTGKDIPDFYCEELKSDGDGTDNICFDNNCGKSQVTLPDRDTSVATPSSEEGSYESGDIWKDPKYNHCVSILKQNGNKWNKECYPGNNETDDFNVERKNSCLQINKKCYKVHRDGKFLEPFFSSPSIYDLPCLTFKGENFYMESEKGLLLKVTEKTGKEIPDFYCEELKSDGDGTDNICFDNNCVKSQVTLPDRDTSVATPSSEEGSYESGDIWKDPRYNHCVLIMKQNGNKWNKECYPGNNETDDFNVERKNSCLQINKKCYKVHRDGKFLEPFFSSPSIYDLPCLTFKGENFYMDSEKGLLLKVTEKTGKEIPDFFCEELKSDGDGTDNICFDNNCGKSQVTLPDRDTSVATPSSEEGSYESGDIWKDPRYNHCVLILKQNGNMWNKECYPGNNETDDFNVERKNSCLQINKKCYKVHRDVKFLEPFFSSPSIYDLPCLTFKGENFYMDSEKVLLLKVTEKTGKEIPDFFCEELKSDGDGTDNICFDNNCGKSQVTLPDRDTSVATPSSEEGSYESGDIWKDPRYNHCVLILKQNGNMWNKECYPGNNETDDFNVERKNSCLQINKKCYKVHRDGKFLEPFFSSPSIYDLPCLTFKGENFYMESEKGLLLKVTEKTGKEIPDFYCEELKSDGDGTDNICFDNNCVKSQVTLPDRDISVATPSSEEGSYESGDIWKDPKYNHCVLILKQNGNMWNKECYPGNNETDDFNVERKNSCLQINKKCYKVHRDVKFLEPFFSSPSIYDLPCLTFKGENFYMESEKGLLLKVTEKTGKEIPDFYCEELKSDGDGTDNICFDNNCVKSQVTLPDRDTSVATPSSEEGSYESGDIWKDPKYNHCVLILKQNGNMWNKECYPGNNETDDFNVERKNSCLQINKKCYKVHRDVKFLEPFFSSPSIYDLPCLTFKGENFYMESEKGLLLKVTEKTGKEIPDFYCEELKSDGDGTDNICFDNNCVKSQVTLPDRDISVATPSSEEGSYESGDIWKDPKYNHCVLILKQNGNMWNKECYPGNNETDDFNVERKNSCLQINKKCYKVHRDVKFLEPFFSSPSIYDLPCLTFKGENFYMESEKGLLLKVTEKTGKEIPDFYCEELKSDGDGTDNICFDNNCVKSQVTLPDRDISVATPSSEEGSYESGDIWKDPKYNHCVLILKQNGNMWNKECYPGNNETDDFNVERKNSCLQINKKCYKVHRDVKFLEPFFSSPSIYDLPCLTFKGENFYMESEKGLLLKVTEKTGKEIPDFYCEELKSDGDGTDNICFDNNCVKSQVTLPDRDISVATPSSEEGSYESGDIWKDPRYNHCVLILKQNGNKWNKKCYPGNNETDDLKSDMWQSCRQIDGTCYKVHRDEAFLASFFSPPPTYILPCLFTEEECFLMDMVQGLLLAVGKKQDCNERICRKLEIDASNDNNFCSGGCEEPQKTFPESCSKGEDAFYVRRGFAVPTEEIQTTLDNGLDSIMPDYQFYGRSAEFYTISVLANNKISTVTFTINNSYVENNGYVDSSQHSNSAEHSDSIEHSNRPDHSENIEQSMTDEMTRPVEETPNHHLRSRKRSNSMMDLTESHRLTNVNASSLLEVLKALSPEIGFDDNHTAIVISYGQIFNNLKPASEEDDGSSIA